MPPETEEIKMSKYSGIYKRNGKCFKYDFEHSIVEYVCKASKEELADNEEWQKKFGKDLWDIDEAGYIVIDSAGLRAENWKNKEVRDEYLDEWLFELRAECEVLVDACGGENRDCDYFLPKFA